MAIRFQKRLFMFVLICLIFLNVTGCTGGNLSQTPGGAIIYLQILNPNGQIYDITLYNENLGDTKTVGKTNADGFLTIANVIPGNYIIYASDQVLYGGWYGIDFYEILNDENYIEITVREHTPYGVRH